MYATCLFCNSNLGSNEVLEHFPVGRRLAFDSATGRLWVVCKRCERWNLSPLETRWEAIEEAERAFRGTKVRVSTDQIGLAQLGEGLELVRVGAPPRAEFAAWRYGDQFGRRRRKQIAIRSAVALGTMAPLAFAFSSVTLVGSALTVGATVFEHVMDRKRIRASRMFVRDGEGNPLYLTEQNMRGATLIPLARTGGWELRMPHGGEQKGGRRVTTMITGDAALRVLGKIMPHLNTDGGNERRVRDAMDVINAAPSVEHLVQQASINEEAKKTHLKIVDNESNVGALPARIRLALEMVLHESDERKAMDGELAELEARWREADEIARIADSLNVPADIEARLEALRLAVPKSAHTQDDQ